MVNIGVVILCCVCSLFFFAGSIKTPKLQQKLTLENQLKTPVEHTKSEEKPLLSSQLQRDKQKRDPSHHTTAK